MKNAPGNHFQEPLALPGLAGARALVTGSTRGIGWTIATLLAACGTHVAINGRSEKSVVDAAERLGAAYSVDVLACAGSVDDLKDVTRMFKQLDDWGNGRMDIVVCNAGYPLEDELWETPLHAMDERQLESGFAKVHAVDADGARNCTHAALQRMVPIGSGNLIYISSTPAITGYKGTPYTMAKAAVLGLMRDVAVEYAASGVRANALALGNIASGFYHELDDSERERLSREAPMGRWGRCEEVAGAVAFLASDLAGFITGQTIVVDGGRVIR